MVGGFLLEHTTYAGFPRSGKLVLAFLFALFYTFSFRTQSFPKGTERVKIGLPHGTRLFLIFCPAILLIFSTHCPTRHTCWSVAFFMSKPLRTFFYYYLIFTSTPNVERVLRRRNRASDAKELGGKDITQ